MIEVSGLRVVLPPAVAAVDGVDLTIRGGEFVRTDSPHVALCHGCPAAARLCGNPAWRPQWATAPPVR